MSEFEVLKDVDECSFGAAKTEVEPVSISRFGFPGIGIVLEDDDEDGV